MSTGWQNHFENTYRTARNWARANGVVLGGKASQSVTSCELRIRDATLADPLRFMRARTRGMWTTSTPMPRIDMNVVTNLDSIFLSYLPTLMTISTLYVAAAANRFSQTADVSPHSVLAFGSSKLVILWHIKVCPSLPYSLLPDQLEALERSRYQRPRNSIGS